MVFCPRQHWRHIAVTDRRTKQDFAYQIRDVADVYFPGALKIRLVLDNLNTHVPSALYETFEPAEARRITAIGVPLHTGSCLLAEYGGIGTGGSF